ncbi:MAG: sugar ABC transporter ATP-binding protein [Gaiellaceae bacterium]
MTELFRLRARGVRKSFGGVEVLRGVDLDASGGTVLALLGENGAGKSTLVKILAGDYDADAGSIEIAGESHRSLDPLAARRQGIRMIFQELAAAPELSVAENVMLGQWPTTRGLVDWRSMRSAARQILEDLGVQIDVKSPLASLRVAERQVIEIARALVGQARCLILDEPTAALSHEEVERHFAFVERLRDKGVAIIYITHRLDEVIRIADNVQILRDGASVLVGPVAQFSRGDLVTAMVGKELGAVARPVPSEQNVGRPLVTFQSATCGSAFDSLNLTVREGEVVGLYGKIGSGTAEVAEVAFGIRKLTAGTMQIGDEGIAPDGPLPAIEAGVGYLPADRQRDGAFTILSVAENLCAPSWPRLARAKFLISARTQAVAYNRWHDALSIRSRNDPGQRIGTLSGGNQQKVLLGRWLESGSRLLVLVEPTRGVDVGARAEIYRVVRGLAAEGIGVLVMSSDYEEVVQVSDRAVVMARGAITAELTGVAITVERLTAASGE